MALKEACWLEVEAELQSTITSLEKELELEREQHNKEVQKPLTLSSHVTPSKLNGPAQFKQILKLGDAAIFQPDTAVCSEVKHY